MQKKSNEPDWAAIISLPRRGLPGGKGDTSNVLIERVNSSGVGLTIGSIGGSVVRNVTFRNVYMDHPSKGVYIKFNGRGAYQNPTSPGGFIEDVLYENIVIDHPESYPIWIGPAQQDINSGQGGYNPCHGDPCSLCWPEDKKANCDSPAGLFANITLRNITVIKPAAGSAAVIFGNSTRPISNLVFDGVRIIDPPSSGPFGSNFYFCKGKLTLYP